MATSNNDSQSTDDSSHNRTPKNPTVRVLNFDASLSHKTLKNSIKQSLKDTEDEMHQKRIQSLRKELEYLKSTEWQFEYARSLLQ